MRNYRLHAFVRNSAPKTSEQSPEASPRHKQNSFWLRLKVSIFESAIRVRKDRVAVPGPAQPDSIRFEDEPTNRRRQKFEDPATARVGMWSK